MKSHFTACLTVMAGLALATVRAEVLVYEGFSNVGNGGAINGYAAGTAYGFTDAWVTAGPALNNMGTINRNWGTPLLYPGNTLLTPSLSGDNYQWIEYSGGAYSDGYAVRTTLHPVNFGTNGTWYLSFLARTHGNDSSSCVSLKSSTEQNHSGPGFGFGNYYRAGGGLEPGAGPFAIHIGGNHSVNSKAYLNGEQNRVYLMVAKIVTRATGQDELFLKVYDTTRDPVHLNDAALNGQGSQLDAWTVTNTVDVSTVYDQLEIYLAGYSYANLDEIRLGETWLDVTGAYNAPACDADVISINFAGLGTAMASQEQAGLVPVSNWNNAAGTNGVLDSLLNSRGGMTGATLTWNAPGEGVTPVPDRPGDFRMMKTHLLTPSNGTISVTVDNVPFARYYVAVYSDGDNGGDWRRANYALNGWTLNVEDNEWWDYASEYRGLDAGGQGDVVLYALVRTNAFAITGVASGAGTLPQAQVNGIQIISLDNTLDLADLAGGGDGTGTGIDTTLTITRGDGYKSWPVSAVDGLVWPAAGVTPLDSAAHTDDLVAIESGTGNWGAIYNYNTGIGDPAGFYGLGNFSDPDRSILSLHAAKGICFDLDEIRQLRPNATMTMFTAIAGESRGNTGAASTMYRVYLDGKLGARSGHHQRDTETLVSVAVTDNDRFLTLITTDAYNNDGSDHSYFGDPLLHFAAPSKPGMSIIVK